MTTIILPAIRDGDQSIVTRFRIRLVAESGRPVVGLRTPAGDPFIVDRLYTTGVDALPVATLQSLATLLNITPSQLDSRLGNNQGTPAGCPLKSK